MQALAARPSEAYLPDVQIRQLDSPLPVAYVPAEHEAQSVRLARFGCDVPATHHAQPVDPVVPLKLPRGQYRQCPGFPEAVEYSPRAQAVQARADWAGVYVPPLHRAQVLLADPVANVPSAHGEQ